MTPGTHPEAEKGIALRASLIATTASLFCKFQHFGQAEGERSRTVLRSVEMNNMVRIMFGASVR